MTTRRDAQSRKLNLTSLCPVMSSSGLPLSLVIACVVLLSRRELFIHSAQGLYHCTQPEMIVRVHPFTTSTRRGGGSGPCGRGQGARCMWTSAQNLKICDLRVNRIFFTEKTSKKVIRNFGR